MANVLSERYGQLKHPTLLIFNVFLPQILQLCYSLLLSNSKLLRFPHQILLTDHALGHSLPLLLLQTLLTSSSVGRITPWRSNELHCLQANRYQVTLTDANVRNLLVHYYVPNITHWVRSRLWYLCNWCNLWSVQKRPKFRLHSYWLAIFIHLFSWIFLLILGNILFIISSSLSSICISLFSIHSPLLLRFLTLSIYIRIF